MNRSTVLTNFPLQITFRRLKAPPDAERWIRREASKLEVFHKRIMSCRVAIERPLRRRESNPYHVRIDLTVPGGELVVGREPTLKAQALRLGVPEIEKNLETRTPHKDLRKAINDAFRAVGRHLQDYVRRQRGDVKHREPSPKAIVRRRSRPPAEIKRKEASHDHKISPQT